MAVDILELLRQGFIGEEPVSQEDDLNKMLEEGAQIKYPEPEPPGIMSQLLAGVGATPETAVTLATGMLAAPISGLAGAFAAPVVGIDKAAEIIPRIQEALTYQPRGEVAGESAALAMKPFEVVHESADWWGKKIAEATGLPELGAAAAVGIESAALFATPGLAKGGLKISKSTALKLRRKLGTAKSTGNFNDPGLTKVLQDVLAETKKDPATNAIIGEYMNRLRTGQPTPPPGAPTIEGRVPLTKPTANEIVRQRIAEREAAAARGEVLPPTGAKAAYELAPEEPVVPEVVPEAKTIAEMNPITKSITPQELVVEPIAPEVPVKVPRRKQKITFKSQATKHGVEFKEEIPTGEGNEVVGRYYDPQTQEYFNVNSPSEVGFELKAHRENVVASKEKYSSVSLEDFGRLVQDWHQGKGLDISAIKEEVMNFLDKKPKSDFETNADYMDFIDRGEELLGIINRGMRNKGLVGLEEAVVDPMIIPELKDVLRATYPKESYTVVNKAPEKGLAIANLDKTTNEVVIGTKKHTHPVLAEEMGVLMSNIERGWVDSSGQFYTAEEALANLPEHAQGVYKEIASTAGGSGKGLDSLAWERTRSTLEDGNIGEPKMIDPKDRLAYMKEFGKKRSRLKQEQIETALEEGEDISRMLPDEAQDVYEAFREAQESALESSEPRDLGDIVRDVNTYLGESGSLSLDVRKLSHEQRMALQRLVADAKRTVGDLTNYLEQLGFTKEQIAIIRRHVDDIRKTEPETFQEPRQHWIDARAIANGDSIVKQRKPGRGRQAPPVYKSEVDMIQQAKELPVRKFAGFENPIRTLEQADPSGTGLKEVYYDYREAEQLYRREFEGVKQEIKDLRAGVDWGSRKRIGAYAIAQQERGRNILARMGVKVPELTEFEMSKYEALRGKFDQLFERINTTREMIGREKLEKVDNYFTFFRTFGVLDRAGITSNPVLDKAPQVQSKYAKYGSTPFRFGIERIVKGSIPVELDPFRVYEKYTETALRHIHLSPWVSKMRELMLTLPDPKTGKMSWKLSQHKPNLNQFLNDWVNHISGYPSNWKLPRVYEKGLSLLNRNLAFSILGANARSTLIQVSALRNTIPEIGFKHTIAGIIDSVTDIGRGFESRRFALENSKILDGRAYDAAVQDAMATLRGGRLGAIQEAVGRVALKPLQWLDMETAIATWNGAYKLAIEQGKKGRQAINFADDVVTRTQASALPGDLAPIQRSVLGKTFTLFQTFVINDWGFLTRDVLGLGNVTMSNTAALKKVMSYVAATTLFNIAFEAAGLQSPFPTPISDIIKSRKINDPAYITAEKVAFGLLDPIPVIGSARYGKGPGGPTVEAIGEAVKSLRGAPMAKSIPEALGVFSGVPGISQAGKSIRAKKRGEGIYGQIVGRYEPTVPSAGRKRGLGGLKGLGKLSGI